MRLKEMRITKGKYDDNQAINNRESWLKVILILLFSFIISWKIITTPLNIDLSDFNFSDFLSLQLALFAIILALVFYLKANETSNKFYDNTYKFTTDISILLGRIEAGFGERLRHLDEGYTGLVDRFDRIPIDVTKVKEQVVEEEEEIKEKEREYNQLIETLAERAKLQEDEKTELFNNLKNTESELNIAKDELDFLERKLLNAEKNADNKNFHEQNFYKVNVLMSLLIAEIGRKTIIQGDVEEIQKRFDTAKISPIQIKYLLREGLIDGEEKLTEDGIIALQKYSLNKVSSLSKYQY